MMEICSSAGNCDGKTTEDLSAGLDILGGEDAGCGRGCPADPTQDHHQVRLPPDERQEVHPGPGAAAGVRHLHRPAGVPPRQR